MSLHFERTDLEAIALTMNVLYKLRNRCDEENETEADVLYAAIASLQDARSQLEKIAISNNQPEEF